MPELAKHVIIRRTGDEYEFSVDGQSFPWHVAADGFAVLVDKNSMPRVTLTLIAEKIDVTHDLAKTKGND